MMAADRRQEEETRRRRRGDEEATSELEYKGKTSRMQKRIICE